LMSPSSIPWEKRYYRFLAGSGRNSLPKHPIHSIYASACICDLLEMRHQIRTHQALPAQTVADAWPMHISRKTRESDLKTSRQARCDFPRLHPEFCGIRAAVSRPAVYRSFVLTEEVLE